MSADSPATDYSRTTCFVVEETCRRRVSEVLKRYGIATVNEPEVSVPTVSVDISLVSFSMSDQCQYLVKTGTKLTRLLVDPLTGLRINSTVWSKSSVNIQKGKPVGLAILSQECVNAQVRSLIRNEYGKCIYREAIRQLMFDGSLPSHWEKALSSYRD